MLYAPLPLTCRVSCQAVCHVTVSGSRVSCFSARDVLHCMTGSVRIHTETVQQEIKSVFMEEPLHVLTFVHRLFVIHLRFNIFSSECIRKAQCRVGPVLVQRLLDASYNNRTNLSHQRIINRTKKLKREKSDEINPRKMRHRLR